MKELLLIILLIVGCEETESVPLIATGYEAIQDSTLTEDYWSCTHSECCSPNQTLEYDSTADSIIFHSTWDMPEICANECNSAQVTICTTIPDDPFTSADDDTTYIECVLETGTCCNTTTNNCYYGDTTLTRQ